MIDIKALNSLKNEFQKERLITDVMPVNDINKHLKFFKESQKDNFIFDEYNIKKVTMLIKYFNGQECGLNLDKGLCLYGSYGVGKSFLMDAMRVYISAMRRKETNIFRTVSVEQLISDVDDLEQYLKQNLCIDEFGSEIDSDIKIYGSPAKEYIERFLMRRYEMFSKGKATHITTNLTPETIASHYNNRLVDRFSEMFNMVEINGESKRK